MSGGSAEEPTEGSPPWVRACTSLTSRSTRALTPSPVEHEIATVLLLLLLPDKPGTAGPGTASASRRSILLATTSVLSAAICNRALWKTHGKGGEKYHYIPSQTRLHPVVFTRPPILIISIPAQTNNHGHPMAKTRACSTAYGSTATSSAAVVSKTNILKSAPIQDDCARAMPWRSIAS